MFKDLFSNQERRKTILWVVIILVCALLLLVVVNFLFSNDTDFIRLLNWSNPSKYQAVFLSNGQAYFGKVSDVNSQTLVLEDIYYLRAVQNLQTGQEDGETADNFSLIKLGDEIHGPEDKMNINLSHVLFVEDLKDSSKVVKAIEEYVAK